MKRKVIGWSFVGLFALSLLIVPWQWTVGLHTGVEYAPLWDSQGKLALGLLAAEWVGLGVLYVAIIRLMRK